MQGIQKRMQTMFKLLSALTAMGIFSLAWAAPYSVEDFSHRATLSDAKTSLRQIEIPQTLYEKMKRRDYGDLRVFSADGQIVPHQFKQSSQRVDSKREIPLVFYPFSKEQAANPSNIQVIINQKAGEQNLQINQQVAKSGKASKTNEYKYIIENQGQSGKKALKLCKLQLNWEQNKASSIISFRLESSDQLHNWHMLSRKLTVSKLDYNGSQLIHDTVNFSCTSQKYLRLTWLQSEQKTKLTQIKGLYTQKGEQQIQWKSFGKPSYSKDENAWLFESNIISEVSKLEFIAPQDGLLYKGTLYSRNNEKGEWRYRRDVSQYRLNMGDTTLQSNPVSFSPTSDRYWKMTLKAEGQLSENQLPEIRAGWKPKRLYFLAQGNGPFVLAFGNSKVKSQQNSSLTDLIDSIRQTGASIDVVSTGKIVSSGKTFTAESETPWKLILLWLVLILGTALMGFMAFRLFKQMNEGK